MHRVARHVCIVREFYLPAFKVKPVRNKASITTALNVGQTLAQKFVTLKPQL